MALSEARRSPSLAGLFFFPRRTRFDFRFRRRAPSTPDELAGHEAILFRDPQTGRPFPWEFHRDGRVTEIGVSGRVVMDDPSVAIAACLGGQGVFQSFAMGLGAWLENGALVQILREWSEERYPLYAYHPSRHMPPAKVRAFIDFIQEIAAMESIPGLPISGKSPV
jgi:DNA-binding transcriptional LysR family regulator